MSQGYIYVGYELLGVSGAKRWEEDSGTLSTLHTRKTIISVVIFTKYFRSGEGTI